MNEGIKELPRQDYAVIDVETTMIKDGEIPETLFWGYADADGYKGFKTTKKLLEFLSKLDRKVLLHHSNFDVIQMLVDGCDSISVQKSHNGKLITCSLQDKHKLLNSYSVFPLSMEKIFKAFGYKKTSLKELEKRNYEDCVNGLDCFLRLDNLFNNLVFVSPLRKGTIAATGFAAAESCAGRMPKELALLDAYRGGRVEAFDLREQDCSKFDICSSYPASFLDAPESSTLLEVRVTTKDWHCPLFDADTDDLLLFPNGNFRSYVYADVWEKYIEPHCEKTSLKIIKKRKIKLDWLCRLKELIKTVYERKENSEGGIKLVCKLVLNSLYGRIGLKGESERCRILKYRPDGDDIAIYPIGDGRYLCFDKIQSESRANFPMAAYITDNARGRLFRAFKRNEAVYGDTDSLFTGRETVQENLGNECGQWKVEGREKFKAHNVKDYEFGGEIVRKGGTGGTIWSMKRFAKGLPAMEIEEKERLTGLRKRIVNANGTTEPIKI